MIDDCSRRHYGLEFARQLPTTGFTAKHEAFAGEKVCPGGGCQERSQMRGNNLETVNAIAMHIGRERFGIGPEFLRYHVKASAATERRKNRGIAEIGGEG